MRLDRSPATRKYGLFAPLMSVYVTPVWCRSGLSRESLEGKFFGVLVSESTRPAVGCTERHNLLRCPISVGNHGTSMGCTSKEEV